MHRRSLLAMLDGYADRHPEEATIVERIRELVNRHADCFERTCRPGHITGSAWVLSHDRQRCLLVHHAKLGKWLQPGGHADGNPNVPQVALQEVREESGLCEVMLVGDEEEVIPLDVDVHTIPARFGSPGNTLEDAHEHHDIRFLAVAQPGQELVRSDESHDVRWFRRRELLEITQEESVLRMLRKAGPQ
jgi:8-oxo-dGTP pyrophosphatase MutT (NUDIX family)